MLRPKQQTIPQRQGSWQLLCCGWLRAWDRSTLTGRGLLPAS